MEQQSNYSNWETEVADQISEKLDCDYGDASGVIEAHPFLMSQCWGLGLSAEETANKIITQ